MKKIAVSAVVAVLLVAGIAYGQVALATQAVQGQRFALKIVGFEWKDVSFRADDMTFENGELRLSGNVRLSRNGRVTTSQTAVFRSGLVILEDPVLEAPAIE